MTLDNPKKIVIFLEKMGVGVCVVTRGSNDFREIKIGLARYEQKWPSPLALLDRT